MTPADESGQEGVDDADRLQLEPDSSNADENAGSDARVTSSDALLPVKTDALGKSGRASNKKKVVQYRGE